jgi:hypothetical protein
MKIASWTTTAAAIVTVVCAHSFCWAQTVVKTDFSKGDFESLDWKAEGGWSIITYRTKENNPGPVARYPANQPADQPDGTLTKTFDEIKNPQKLVLSIDVGWGWGKPNHANPVAFMLVDDEGNGYVFQTNRAKASWAAQWAPVKDGRPPVQKTWATEPIDATHASIMNGGGLERLNVTRDAKGRWTFSCKDWNLGEGGSIEFTDTTTKSFTKLVLLGGHNIDEVAFNHIILVVAK